MLPHYRAEARAGTGADGRSGDGRAGAGVGTGQSRGAEAQLEGALNQLLARMTAQSGAVLAMAKKAVLGGIGLSLRDALRFSMDVFLHELYRLEDSQEGLRALIEKRKPEWKNR